MLSVLITHRKSYQKQNKHTNILVTKFLEVISMCSPLFVVMVSQYMYMSKLIKMYTLNMCNFWYAINFIIPIFKTDTT